MMQYVYSRIAAAEEIADVNCTAIELALAGLGGFKVTFGVSVTAREEQHK